jgi:hypothetical protein
MHRRSKKRIVPPRWPPTSHTFWLCILHLDCLRCRTDSCGFIRLHLSVFALSSAPNAEAPRALATIRNARLRASLLLPHPPSQKKEFHQTRSDLETDIRISGPHARHAVSERILDHMQGMWHGCVCGGPALVGDLWGRVVIFGPITRLAHLILARSDLRSGFRQNWGPAARWTEWPRPGGSTLAP